MTFVTFTCKCCEHLQNILQGKKWFNSSQVQAIMSHVSPYVHGHELKLIQNFALTTFFVWFVLFHMMKIQFEEFIIILFQNSRTTLSFKCKELEYMPKTLNTYKFSLAHYIKKIIPVIPWGSNSIKGAMSYKVKVLSKDYV